MGRGMIILLSRMTKLVRLATGALRRLSLAKKKENKRKTKKKKKPRKKSSYVL